MAREKPKGVNDEVEGEMLVMVVAVRPAVVDVTMLVFENRSAK